MTTDFMRRHRAGVLLIFFISFSITALALRVDPYITGIKTVIWYLVSPEVVYSGQFFNKLDSLRGRVFRLFHVEGENFILRQQNSELAKKDVERDALEAENNRFRELLGLKERQFPDAIAAEVIGRDPRDWFHSVVINKGRKDGVIFSAAVVTGTSAHPALVGRIMEVLDETSKVLLITDAISAVSVSFVEREDVALLEGRNKPWLLLNYLSPDSEVAPGDSVISVGLGGVFPPGIPVGQITKVSSGERDYFKSAQVSPISSLDSLREVLVLQRLEKTEGGLSQ